MGTKRIIIGVGNTLRKDDGIGPYIIKKLKRKNLNCLLIDAGETPENYIETILQHKPEELIIIDATDFGAEPGEWKIFSERDLKKEKISTLSSHSLPLSLWIALLKKEIPSLKIQLIGIQPADIGLGDTISEILKEKSKEIINFLLYNKKF